MVGKSETEFANVLNALAARARAGEKDMSAAIGVVNDLGYLISGSAATDIRLAQAAVAAVREQLRSDHAVNTPEKALTDSQSHSFLAGALWAVNELMTARLDSLAATPLPGHRTRRAEVRDLALSALASGEALSPTAVLASVSHADASTRLDEISRGLGELLADGLVVSAAADPGADRRRKYFAITAEGQRELAVRPAVG